MQGKQMAGWVGWVFAFLSVALTTGLIHIVPGAERISNVSLLYLLAVMATAYCFGGGPAAFAAVASVLSFDWYFVEPRHNLTVDKPEQWVALAIFLLTSIVISRLTETLRLRAGEARQRELEASALSRAGWAVASQVDHQETLQAVLQQIDVVLPCEAAAIFSGEPDGSWTLVAAHCKPGFDAKSLTPTTPAAPEKSRKLPGAAAIATSVSTRLAPNGSSNGSSNGAPNGQHHPDISFPLRLHEDDDDRLLGVLVLRRRAGAPLRPDLETEGWPVVQSLAKHAAVALERHRLTLAEAQARGLQEADKLKTALLSMVSHDFRSPLAAIKASVTGLLQVGGLPWDEEARHELLSAIDVETDRLNRMVGDILALSKLDADAWRPQRELVALADVIGSALNPFPPAEDARILVKIDPALPEVWLDSVQMVQVLHNLLENALKYSPPGSPVDLVARLEHGGLAVHVQDRGFGLVPGEEDQIFQRFYRGKRWQESAVPGSGIGLAICRGLVEAHGGQLRATSRDGGGTCFTIQMPLDYAPPEVAAMRSVKEGESPFRN